MSRAARTLLGALLALVIVTLVAAPQASAFWSAGGSGGGAANTATIGATATPTVSVAGATVTVSWTQSSVAATTVGALGGGYVVRRYPSGGGAAITPAAGSCASTISGAAATLTCTETSVPVGTWRYTVRPVLQSWTGATSATSAIATVAASGPVMNNPGRYVRATVTLSGSAGTVSGTLSSTTIQGRQVGTTAWTDVCTAATNAISCSYNSVAAPDGDYELRLRVITTGPASTTYSPIVTPVTVDNTAPTNPAFSSWPAANLAGTVTLTGSGNDATSGIGSIRFEYKLTSGTTWATACTTPDAPLSCSWNIAGLADGYYDVRIVLIDRAGNSFTQASGYPTSRRIDNTPPAVTLTAPPARVRAGVNWAATASDAGAGMQRVVFQIRSSPSGSWSDACTNTGGGPAFSCYFDTTTRPDGSYDVRAVAYDNAGASATTAPATTIIDNTAPLPTDAQLSNGTRAAGRPDAGDTIVYSWSEAMAPASYLAGWNGTATAVRVRLEDWGNTNVSIRNAAGSATLPFGNLGAGGDYTNGQVEFDATMVLSGGVVTVTLDSVISGTVSTSSANATASWQPAYGPTDLAGNAASQPTITESGAADRNF